jgi:Tol biopolymer transport system component
VFATEDIRVPNRNIISQLWAVDVATGEKQLITEGDAVQPSWSPHGHRIAYWALPLKPARFHLWTIRADGSKAVPITNDDHINWNPVWSPDGNYLYFSSDRGGTMSLWRIPIDEQSGEVLGEPEPVTVGASARHFHFALSRDGRRIAYDENVETRNLHKVNFDASTEKILGQPIQITRGSKAAANPSLSPDGEWLTFDSFGERQILIYIIRTDGSDRRQLTGSQPTESPQDIMPRWSPAGNRIAFHSDRSGVYRIWTIHPDGSSLELLREASVGTETWLPVWSPNGSRMAFLSDLGLHIAQLGKSSEEHSPELLPPLGEAGERFQVSSWSPDGKWLAGGVRTGHAAGIAIYNLASQQYRRLTDSGAVPVWLSDSRRLLYRDSGRIFLVDSGTGSTREVLSISADSVLGQLTISHDNRWIYFSVYSSEADIWMLTLDESQ